ncbi:paraquat-inducible protein A [Marinibactrum halimedae]|uniref:Paraquat-inducible protein A n=2 Tax=Marinibactrum halimedae TaxID=1444977 RepID=A0AA37WN59_9GAMM|nr:paraquat-inducible protein A [Marinibactrum halimedae]
MMLLASLPFDFLSLSAQGQYQVMDIGSGMETLIHQHYWALAVVQSVAIFLIPAVLLIGILSITLPVLLFNTVPGYAAKALRLVATLQPWSMAEIFLIGALVSLTKIAALADVNFGLSFYAYLLFSILMVVTLLRVDFWQLRHHLKIPEPHPQAHPHSVQHTWALLITASLFYLPASLLPIMQTLTLGQDDPNTIFGGVVTLWHHGSYVIASIIFVASVFVPIAKIGALAWLNYSVSVSSSTSPHQRLQLYRITEALGRWSMIDVFVVAVLVSIVQLGNAISIFPGPAALAFTGVVIITMIAAMTFDSTQLFQHQSEHH